jgi:hypothetical protein
MAKPTSTRTPVKKTPANQTKISSAASFKKTKYHELLLPSDNVALCKRPGLQHFINSGKVPNALMPAMDEALKGEKSKAVESIDADAIKDIAAFADSVVIECVIEPHLVRTPSLNEDGQEVDEHGEPMERDEDTLYLDEIDDEDKNFIMQWAFGGTTDIAKFRNQQAAELGALQSS